VEGPRPSAVPEAVTAGSAERYGRRRAYDRHVHATQAVTERDRTANAIEWSPSGATVHAELRGEREEVVVTVDDAGPGVPDELRNRIFEPFFRGRETENRRIGYGLGLGMVHSAVRNQGGTVSVETSPAGGARFKMVLLRDAGEDPPQTAEPSALVA